MIGLLFALSCASLFGLEELDELPGDFPLDLPGDRGNVTQSPGGHVAVDAGFETEAEARAAWDALTGQGVGAGFVQGDTERRGKHEVRVLEGPGGKLELHCCPQRADRSWLVLVSWFRP